MNADAAGYVLEDTPDDIRARTAGFYRDCFEADIASLVAAGELTPDEAARVVDMVMAQWFVRDSIESFVARHTGGLH